MPLTMSPRTVTASDITHSALPVGVGTFLQVDAYSNVDTLAIPTDAKWMLFSGSVGFVVSYFGGSLPAVLPPVGSPSFPGPINGQMPPVEISPGLRAIPDGVIRSLKITGLAVGVVSVSYFK